MKIVVVSDTHGRHDELGLLSGDVLIHCGDASTRSKTEPTRRRSSTRGSASSDSRGSSAAEETTTTRSRRSPRARVRRCGTPST